MQLSIWQPSAQFSAQEEQIVTRIRPKLFVFLHYYRHELFDESFQLTESAVHLAYYIWGFFERQSCPTCSMSASMVTLP